MQPRGPRGGIAIILYYALAQGWKKGELIIKEGGIMVGKTTRLLQVNNKVEGKLI